MAATNRFALHLILLGVVGQPAFGGAITRGPVEAPAEGAAPVPGEPRPAVAPKGEDATRPRTEKGSLAPAATGPTRGGLRFNYRPVGIVPVEEADETRNSKSSESATTTSSTTPTTITSTPSTSAPEIHHAPASGSGTASGEPLAAPVSADVPKLDGKLELATTPGHPGSNSSSILPASGDASRASTAISPSPVAAAATAAASSLSNRAAATSSASSSSTSAPSAVADAYLNFGPGPYAESKTLTTGDAKPWYTSPVVSRLYGGNTPDAQDRASFESKVVSTVEKTYEKAGVPVRVTTDPAADAAHTLSVVANTQAAANPNAIGIASVGYNGFTFIDKFTESRTADDLATAVGHNVAHELMHTFGIADHPESTGDAVDAATATWASLHDPNASFSQPAANLLSTLNLQATDDLMVASAGSHPIVESGQEAMPAPVPEPSAVALWALAGAVGFALKRRASGR